MSNFYDYNQPSAVTVRDRPYTYIVLIPGRRSDPNAKPENVHFSLPF